MKKEKNYCICKCGHRHIIDKREIALFDGMGEALARVYKWCKEKGKNEFQRKEIEHLLLDGNQKARFGDWVFFGGLAYKGDKKGDWGINMNRCEKFFANQKAIATRVLKDPMTKQMEKLDYELSKEIPGMHEC